MLSTLKKKLKNQPSSQTFWLHYHTSALSTRNSVKMGTEDAFRSDLLLLLSRFSRVRLCVTPQTAAHQAPPSLGFSRQEHWSGLPFPSPMYASESESDVAQSCQTLSDPMDCSLPGSSVHGIFQARILEWGAIAFSVRSVHQVLNTSLP